jgi:predicted RNA binding protein YcfA (HicA-like mRNA interferase family)
MSIIDKLMFKVLRGNCDTNIPFDDLIKLLNYFGFEERIRGDHHIFAKKQVEEIINIQPLGSKAKAYQVKQVRNLIIKYKLGGEEYV